MWYGFYDGIPEQMVLQPDGQFSAIEAGFDYYLWMVGNWAQMPGQNVIEFKVTNYFDFVILKLNFFRVFAT